MRMVFSNSMGVCQSSAEWRRRRLWKASMYSKIALASSTRVFHRCRLLAVAEFLTQPRTDVQPVARVHGEVAVVEERVRVGPEQ